MESVFSFGSVNGVIDHSGNCNISINQMKALFKVCCVRGEMHLDYFIPQNLLRDSYLLHSLCPLIGYLIFECPRWNVLKKSLFLNFKCCCFLSRLAWSPWSYGAIKNKRLLMGHLRSKWYHYSLRSGVRAVKYDCIITQKKLQHTHGVH